MIPRYVRKEMQSIWSEQSKFQAYLDIELLNAKALAKKGILSDDELALLLKNATFSVQRIEELELDLKHDVIAFTRNVSETLGKEKRFIHYGLTSTDVVDTANAIRLKKANQIIKNDLVQFLDMLKMKAMEYKNTFCIGRTHGIHADITVFGLKWTLWYDETKRNLHRFEEASFGVEIGKISGAVGNYAFIDPEIETYICENLGIQKAKISTQTLQRDRHAHYISVIALIGTTLEKIATEIRHLQRTEINEVREPFDTNQKGSSAMPHKKNPITSENICGLARVLRGYVIPTYENIPLWHERDISHSSVERIVLPDATSLIDYMLNKYMIVLSELKVFPNKMIENIQLTNGAVFSQRILNALIEKGFSREKAYDLIQELAYISYDFNRDFKEILLNSKEITQVLSLSEINELFELDFYKAKVDYIYNQVFE
ncbi:MAG: adenylosuccinate lyase [Firmicutes bacterium]|nr:adenylosuccinate lyase [Bacillota bacterium]